MSTENVSLFIQSVSDNNGLGERVADMELSCSAWSSIAADIGFEFTDEDFHTFVCQVLGRSHVKHEDALGAFLSEYEHSDELNEEELDMVAGGGRGSRRSALRFKSTLFARMKYLGFSGLGRGAATSDLGRLARTVIV